jgi:hypothetical protein
MVNPRMVFRESDGAVYLYGGAIGSAIPNGTMWKYLDGEWSTVCNPCAPGPRYQQALVYDSRRDRFVLFGGLDGTLTAPVLLGDTWIYTDAGWSELTTTSSPPPGFGHHAAYDPVRDAVVLVGGTDNDVLYDEVWELVADDWQQSAESFPFGIGGFGQSAFFDSVRGEIGFFGGRSAGSVIDALWYFDGTRWAQTCSACSGRARDFAAATFDPTLRHVVIVGGYDGAEIGGTTHLDATGSVALVDRLVPSPRDSMGIAYDSARDVIVVFGGNGPTCDGDCDETLEYQLVP